MRLGLPRLQKNNIELKELRKNLLEDQIDVKKIYYHQSFLYVLEIIYFKIINYHHNILLADYIRIEKTRELIAKN